MFSLPAKQDATSNAKLSAECVKLLNATALGRKYLASWSKPELHGYCRFLQKFPDGLGNAVINVMREKWYSDNMVKRAVQLDAEGSFKNFFKRGHPMTVIKKSVNSRKAKTVDGVFDVSGPRAYHVKAKALNTELRNWRGLTKAILSQAKYFEYSSLGGILDNTIVIELRKGTTLSKKTIQAAIWHAFDDNEDPFRMINVSRVGVYNTKKDSVILYTKENWLGSERP